MQVADFIFVTFINLYKKVRLEMSNEKIAAILTSGVIQSKPDEFWEQGAYGSLVKFGSIIGIYKNILEGLKNSKEPPPAGSFSKTSR